MDFFTPDGAWASMNSKRSHFWPPFSSLRKLQKSSPMAWKNQWDGTAATARAFHETVPNRIQWPLHESPKSKSESKMEVPHLKGSHAWTIPPPRPKRISPPNQPHKILDANGRATTGKMNWATLGPHYHQGPILTLSRPTAPTLQHTGDLLYQTTEEKELPHHRGF